MGRLLGSLKDFSGADLGGVAIKAALERAGISRRPGRLRDHGPGAPSRRRADHRPPGRRQGRHPDECARADHQQGLPVRPGRDRAGRPADPGGRVRRHRGWRHGVDDQAPHLLPKSREGYKYGDVELSTPWLTTGCTAPSTQSDGRGHRGLQLRHGIDRESRTSSQHDLTSGRAAQKNGLFDEEIVPVEHPATEGRAGGVRQDEGIRAETTAEMLGRLRPAFKRTARSRPASPRRSPTAPPPSWS